MKCELSIYAKPKVELVYEDVTLNQIQDIFLIFSKIMTEKQEETAEHTSIARDDYKIEDMMLIIEEAFGSKMSYIWMNFSQMRRYESSNHPFYNLND